MFPNKKLKINVDSINSVSLETTLIDTTDVLSIPCSFTNILKQEFLSEVDRECKLCLNTIIVSIEFDNIFNYNKKHMILLNKSQNILPRFTCFPLNNFIHDKFYFNNIYLNQDKIVDIFN